MIPGPNQASSIVVFACLPALCPISLSSLPLNNATLSAQVRIDRRVKPRPATRQPDDAPATLRVEAPLVLVPVHVSTPLGAPVTNLKKSDFRVFEDNVEQTITHFSTEDAPLSVGLLLDASGSMRDKMRTASEAAGQFLQMSNSEDEVFLIEFNERPTLSLPFTQNAAKIRKRILHAKPLGRTSLLDAVHLALSQMKKAQKARKALVILSDGGDNHSGYTEYDIKQAMRESDVQVYAMAILDPDVSAKRAAEERNGPHLLNELAQESGGGYYEVDNLDELPAVCARIGTELRTQYLLGYSPISIARDGKYRRIRVTLVALDGMPALKLHHRSGYYAPAQ